MAASIETLRHLAQTTMQSTSADLKAELKSFLLETLRSLETPGERLWDIMFYPHQCAVVRAGIEMRLFHTLSESENKEVTAQELAEKVPGGADRLLVVRIMRMLAGMGVVKEVGFGTYKNAPVGETVAKDIHLEGGMKFMYVPFFSSKATAPCWGIVIEAHRCLRLGNWPTLAHFFCPGST